MPNSVVKKGIDIDLAMGQGLVAPARGNPNAMIIKSPPSSSRIAKLEEEVRNLHNKVEILTKLVNSTCKKKE